jgi:hypothetical protein
MKSFEKWKTQEVEDTFGIHLNKNMAELNDWLKANYSISTFNQELLLSVQNQLVDFVDYYNESDISLFFIGSVLNVVKFMNEEYRAYTQLKMNALANDIQGNNVSLNGRVELAVAKGKQIASTPFFFMNEYKQENSKGPSDAKGQLLISMYAAQVLNKDEFPIYGCYIKGRNWFFVILKGKEYAVSSAYDATQSEIFNIYSILMECKKYIHQRLNLPFP